MTEDEIIIVLARLEKLAADNALLLQRNKQHAQRADALTHKIERGKRAERDLKLAEDKIAEWLSHSESMSRLVPKARHKEIGPLPKPLETEIPF